MTRTVRLLAVLVLAFLTLPSALILVLSFSGEPHLSFPPKSWSIDSYAAVLNSGPLRSGLFRSLVLGFETVGISLIVGLPASLAILRMRGRLRSSLVTYLTLGFASPLVVSGVALVVVYYEFSIFGSLWSLAFALSIIHLPFLLYSSIAASDGVDPHLEEAANTMGARPLERLVLVRLPGIFPGIITGTLLIFSLTLSEFIVSLLLTTSSSATLPVVMYGSMRSGLTPTLAAASMFYVVLAALIVVGITRFRSLRQFLHRGD